MNAKKPAAWLPLTRPYSPHEASQSPSLIKGFLANKATTVHRRPTALKPINTHPSGVTCVSPSNGPIAGGEGHVDAVGP